MKNIFTIILAVAMFASFVVASADIEISHSSSDYAVFLSGDFDGKTFVIQGSLYSADGDAKFDGSGTNIVDGNIVLNNSKNVVPKNKNSQPYISGNIVKTDTMFNESVPAFNFPEIENKIDLYTTGYNENPESIVESAHYKKLEILKALSFDVSQGDLYIIADEFIFLNDIKLIGNGNLYILVNGDLDTSWGGGIEDYGRVKIFVNGDFAHSSYKPLNADLYVNGEKIIVGGSGGKITGNIITNANTVNYTNGSMEGVFYAPYADFKLTRPILGRIVAKTLSMQGGDSKVEYKDIPIDLNPLSVEPPAEDEPPEEEEPPVVEPPADDIPAGEEISLQFPYGYLYGYGDDTGNVGPYDNIKREEATALIYRLLKNNDKLGGYIKPATTIFTDVDTDRWSFASIEYMATLGIYDEFLGKPIFPHRAITRGEAAKIIAFSLRIRPDSSKPDSVNEFTDLDVSNEYYNYIKALVDKGVLNGYGDGTIRPNGDITRAEFVKIINMLIGRDSAYDITELVNPYNDLNYEKTHWVYENIMRASYGFSYNNETKAYEMDPEMKPAREEVDYS